MLNKNLRKNDKQMISALQKYLNKMASVSADITTDLNVVSYNNATVLDMSNESCSVHYCSLVPVLSQVNIDSQTRPLLWSEKSDKVLAVLSQMPMAGEYEATKLSFVGDGPTSQINIKGLKTLLAGLDLRCINKYRLHSTLLGHLYLAPSEKGAQVLGTKGFSLFAHSTSIQLPDEEGVLVDGLTATLLLPLLTEKDYTIKVSKGGLIELKGAFSYVRYQARSLVAPFQVLRKVLAARQNYDDTVELTPSLIQGIENLVTTTENDLIDFKVSPDTGMTFADYFGHSLTLKSTVESPLYGTLIGVQKEILKGLKLVTTLNKNCVVTLAITKEQETNKIRQQWIFTAGNTLYILMPHSCRY